MRDGISEQYVRAVSQSHKPYFAILIAEKFIALMKILLNIVF
jgi:hypothetical protein